MSNTRPGSRGHPSHNRLVLSTREARPQCRRARVEGPDGQGGLERLETTMPSPGRSRRMESRAKPLACTYL